MHNLLLRGFIAISVAIFSILVAVTPTNAGGNNFVGGELRVDSPTVTGAKRYSLRIMSTALPTTGSLNDFTTSWLSIRVDNNETGFTQVGVIAFPDGLRWFVYSKKTVTNCRGGDYFWGSIGCRGSVNDLVALNQWNRFELLKNNNEDFWRARLYNSAGTTVYELARIPFDHNTIYRATATFEEGYIELIDPQLNGGFYLLRPEYHSGGVWNSWPLSADSTSKQNRIFLGRMVNGTDVAPEFICPGVYGVTPNVDINDPWHWYAGTGGIQCGHIFPPAAYDDFHANVTYTGSWTASWGCCPRAWKQSLHWSNATGDGTNNTTTLTTVSGFHPTNSLTRVFTMAPNRGTTRVRIGSTNYDNNDYAAENRWQVARTWSLSGATTLKVFKIAGDATRYSDVDVFLVDVPRAAAVPNNDDRYDNYHYLMRYLGSWTHNSTSVPNAHKDTLSWTNNAGDTVSFTFVGNKIKYHYTRHWNRGIAVITIDGVNYGEVNACSGTTEWHRSDTFPPGSATLGAGVHTINITNSGRTTCGTGSNYTYIDVDHLTPFN
jgi:hypothetical protein